MDARVVVHDVVDEVAADEAAAARDDDVPGGEGLLCHMYVSSVPSTRAGC